MKMLKIKNLKYLLTLLIAFGFAFNSYSKFQVGFTAGTDTPGNLASANKRGITTTATTVKFFLQSGDMFRWLSSFAYNIGTSYSQGEFGVGGVIYPLNSLNKSVMQPFIYVNGFLGLGRFKDSTKTTCGSGGSTACEETRMDAGYELGAGVDIKLLKKYGISFMIESHSGGEASQRMLIGFYTLN